jgi:hypothetical protein
MTYVMNGPANRRLNGCSIGLRLLNGHGRASTPTMKLHMTTYVRVMALGVGMALAAWAAPVQNHEGQNREQDYSTNKTYQQGMREGHNDHARNQDHSKKRHFKKDEDQKAYEAGYQKGRGN